MESNRIKLAEEFNLGPATLTEALGILEGHGFDLDRTRIPKPIEENIMADRIYFLVKIGMRWQAKTAFLEVSLDKTSLEVHVADGWLVELPLALSR